MPVLPDDQRKYFDVNSPALGHCSSIFGHRNSLTAAKLEQLADAGCEYVEISALQQLHLDMFDESRIDQLARKLDKLDMQCWSLHAPFCAMAADDQETRIDAVRLLSLSCHRARQLGSNIVVVHPGRDTESIDADRELHWLRDGLRQVSAEFDDVTLAVETMTESSHQIRSIVAGIDGVGVCFDCGHVHQGHDVCRYVSDIADLIVTVHLHDNSGTRDEHNPPGMGTIKWPQLLTQLHKCYDGVLINEGSAGGADIDAAVNYFKDYILGACRSIP